ncbi:hypothetical protein NLX83_36685 [Allokutzneria sp. A3M-2-11 16]|uniref:hypothetical protein n=1 Tax=Allokutzneria sp. A3M-2-11 16 TaxID=2962043 RepID=UPI0020B8CFF0|nr:hypothetical protein [Allokutzneria sp. A3M-2-11 16]MCP3804818.1 hypothetical protein [Allokutzneria sp. A3M-2-11 16]
MAPPHLDEHAVTVDAAPEAVWAALGDVLDRTFSGAVAQTYARLVGCPDHAASGPRPLAEGSTIAGFRVTAAVPPSELLLEGRHRFSTYALVFRIDRVAPNRTRLRAESRAAFPGAAGRLYRALVIGTGGHVFGVRRLLSGVATRARSR